jgi:hypothetical protein
MTYARRNAAITVVVLVTVASISCDRAEPPPASNKPAVFQADTGTGSNSPPTTGWRVENGPVLVIADDSLTNAMIVPGGDDSLAMSAFETGDSLVVDVFSPAGRMGTTVLRPNPSSRADACLEWPTGRVRRSAGRPLRPWTMGFVSGRVQGLMLDSLAGMRQRDSVGLVSEIAKLASLAPNDTAVMFRGLPFRVHTAYTFPPRAAETSVVATVIRTVNQEANARAEHLLLIGDRDRNVTGAPFVLKYAERSAGPEESSETIEILGVVLSGTDQRPTIVIGRTDESGMGFSLLERDDQGKWHLRWSSPFSDC